MQLLLKDICRKYPIHILLFPVFFICTKYIQYQGLLEITVVLKAGLIISAIIAGFLLLNYFFLKDILKSAINSTCWGFLFFLFGDFREFLQTSSIYFISTYKFFLPILTILLLVIFFTLKKAEKPDKLNAFLNLLLLIYTLTEVIKLIQLSRNNDRVKMESVRFIQVPDSLKKGLPDIYYIVPDCYPSSSFQSEMLNADNTSFDNALTRKCFTVLSNSRSNYNRTAFSMSATFSMTYRSGVSNQKAPDAADYNNAINNVKHAPLFDLLQQNGYNLINLSIFDLTNNHPALRKEKFLSTTTSEMIFGFTFWNYFSRDIFYTWIVDKKNSKRTREQLQYEPLKKYAKQVVDSLVTLNPKARLHPQFIYAHLNFPHFPYFYDSTGTEYAADSLYTDSLITDRKKFAGYIKYSNKQLLNIIDAILEKTNGKAVIVIQSDHGIDDLDISRRKDAFRNYSAFYFPDRNYGNISDNMSNINTFRILLNKYFGQQLSCLTDSTIYVPMR